MTRCFACNKILQIHGAKSAPIVTTRDEQLVPVGPECYKKIIKSGENGYQPPLGGPRLYVDPQGRMLTDKGMI